MAGMASFGVPKGVRYGFTGDMNKMIQDIYQKDRKNRADAQGLWDLIQDFEQRYATNPNDGLKWQLRGLISRYEQLTGTPYQGSARSSADMSPYRAPTTISISTKGGTTIGGGSSSKRQEREARRSEIKSKQAEKADAKKLREIEKQGQDLLKRRNELAQRPGYGEEVERVNEQLAELAFERDYLAGRSPTLKTAEERRLETAESESKIAERESLVEQRKSTAERKKEEDRVRREVSTWIAQNPNNPAVASINKLMSQSKMSGVDPLAIVLQAKALADSEKAKTEERARLQTERLQSMQDRQEDAQAFRLESERARAAERTGARSAAQQQKIVEFIQKHDARIAGLETMIQDAKTADPTLEPNLASRIPGAERELAKLKAERDAWQQMLEANYGTANTDFGSGGSEMVRVRLRNGREGNLPRTRLQEAIADGAQVLE